MIFSWIFAILVLEPDWNQGIAYLIGYTLGGSLAAGVFLTPITIIGLILIRKHNTKILSIQSQISASNSSNIYQRNTNIPSYLSNPVSTNTEIPPPNYSSNSFNPNQKESNRMLPESALIEKIINLGKITTKLRMNDLVDTLGIEKKDLLLLLMENQILASKCRIEGDFIIFNQTDDFTFNQKNKSTPLICTACGSSNDQSSEYCLNCGMKLH
jgi:hypothetical protein